MTSLAVRSGFKCAKCGRFMEEYRASYSLDLIRYCVVCDTQPSLFDIPPKEPSFDGRTFEPKLDQERLTGQLARVRGLMKSGHWYTLREVAACVDGSEAGVSARIRDLRKQKFGGYTIERRRLSIDAAGVWEYRMVV